jgi:hypothetical protein
MAADIKFGGVVQASAWPQLPAQEKTFYLILLGAQPSRGQQNGSRVSQLYEFTMQWTWFVIGTDIASNQQAMNRGDRYRNSMQMQSALTAANFPGFTNKVLLSANPINGQITATPYVPEGGGQTVWWNRIRYRSTVDNAESGLIYTTGAFELYGYEMVADTLSESIWANEGQFNTL